MKHADELVMSCPDACDHVTWEGHEGDSICSQCREDDMTIHLIRDKRAEWLQQIQLNAMKEGMRRAALLTEEITDKQMLHQDCYGVQQAILTAAEQLTMKDL